MLSINS